MRIIGGEFAGRKLTPKMSNWDTRPTSDRVKESLFNILMNRLQFDGLEVLDLYAGTGNISFEFLSRGVTRCISVEKNPKAIRFIEQTADEFGIGDRILTVQKDAIQFLRHTDLNFDVVFADPPYADTRIKELPDMITSNGVLHTSGIFILEHDDKLDFQSHPYCMEHRRYGQTCLSFFSKNDP